MGNGGVQEFSIVQESELMPVDPGRTPLQANVNVLGMPGLTAYMGMVDVGCPKLGETVVVSSAGGGVGSIAGQIAKALGCRVIGIAGGPIKCAHVVDTFGFDACVDYKAPDFLETLDLHCPDRIDLYFDNVGGYVLDECIARIGTHGRVIGCGGVAAYNGEITPLHNYTTLLARQARWESFSYYDLAGDYARVCRATDRLAAWVSSAQILSEEHIFKGIANFGLALQEIYEGKTSGKVILQI